MEVTSDEFYEAVYQLRDYIISKCDTREKGTTYYMDIQIFLNELIKEYKRGDNPIEDEVSWFCIKCRCSQHKDKIEEKIKRMRKITIANRKGGAGRPQLKRIT